MLFGNIFVKRKIFFRIVLHVPVIVFNFAPIKLISIMNYKIYPRALTGRNAKPKGGGGVCENCTMVSAEGANEIRNVDANEVVQLMPNNCTL